MNKGLVIVKVREVYTPYMGLFKCYRVVAASPNMVGRNFRGQQCVSFRKPWLVFESSDLAHGEVMPSYQAKVMSLFGEGYDVEDASTYESRMREGIVPRAITVRHKRADGSVVFAPVTYKDDESFVR